MPTIFHILDAISRDQIATVAKETEDEQEVELTFEEEGERNFGKSKDSRKHERSLVIHLFGMTAEGETLRCDVEGFRPFMYVKLKDPKMSTDTFRSFMDASGKEVPKSLNLEKVKRKELYGFTADEESTFVKLSVGSLKDFRSLKLIFLNDYQEPIFTTSKTAKPLAVYESGLDPLLRFFHVQDIKPCGWVSVDACSDDADEESGVRVL